MDILIPIFILAIPVACIAWTVTHEEVFHEVHDYCERKSKRSKSLLVRKFFYLFTCEYCFSHYVTFFILWMTHYTLFFHDWRGYLLSFFSIVFVSNIYMSLFAKIRINIKRE